MNRREMLQTGLSVLSAVGIDGELATMTPRNPQAFVLSSPGKIAPCHLEAFRYHWDRAFAGTELANVPVIILQMGMKLEVIDASEAPKAVDA